MVLVFRSIGYNEVEKKIGDSPTLILNVELEPSIHSLNETVVIGYGTQKRRNITGDISTVSSDELRKNPVGQWAQALQGKAPGIKVTHSNTPGSGAKIRIHGIGTINNNSPLTRLGSLAPKNS